MTREEHLQRHKLLHTHLDELLADYIGHHPEKTQILSTPFCDFLQWSAEQARNPTEQPGHPDDRDDHEERGFIANKTG